MVRAVGTGIQLPQNPVVGGNILSGVTVMLGSPAGPGGASVRLSSDSASASVPPLANIAPGALESDPFSVSTGAVVSSVVANLGAVLNGVKQTVPLTINPAVPSYVQLSAGSVLAGGSLTASVWLNGKAPAGGDLLSLTYSDTSIANGPASVLVQPGAVYSPPFTIANAGVGAATTIKVSAQLGSNTVSASYVVQPAVLSAFTLSPTTVNGGVSSMAYVKLNGPAGAAGASVKVTTSNAVVVPNQSIAINGQSLYAYGFVATHAVTAQTVVQVTAAYGGSSRSQTLTVLPTVLQSITADAEYPAGGITTTGHAVLAGVATTGGLRVSLKSSNPAVASVPASVVISAGQATAPFAIATTAVSAVTLATITGTLNGVQKTLVLHIQPPSLKSFTFLGSNTLVSGQLVQANVSINGVAPANGIVIALASSNTAVATVPASAPVPAGQSVTSNFAIIAQNVSTSSSATLTATLGSSTATAQVFVVLYGVTQLTVVPDTVVGGHSSLGTITVGGKLPPGNQSVAISCPDPLVGVPGAVIVPSGKTGATFTVTTVPVAITHIASITATLNGVSQSQTFTVTAPPITGIAFSVNPVKGNQTTTATITLSDPAPAGGLPVTLQASPPNLVTSMAANVAVPAGQKTIQVQITVAVVASQQMVFITAWDNTNLKVVPLTISP